MALFTGPSIRLPNASVTFDMTSCAANTTTASTAQALKGARTDMHFLARRPTAMNAGLLIEEVFCDAVDTVKFRFANITAGAIDPASLIYEVIGL